MNPDEAGVRFDDFRRNLSEEERNYLEAYAHAKQLVNMSNKSSEDIKTLVGLLTYLTEMQPYMCSKKNQNSIQFKSRG